MKGLVKYATYTEQVRVVCQIGKNTKTKPDRQAAKAAIFFFLGFFGENHASNSFHLSLQRVPLALTLIQTRARRATDQMSLGRGYPQAVLRKEIFVRGQHAELLPGLL